MNVTKIEALIQEITQKILDAYPQEAQATLLLGCDRPEQLPRDFVDSLEAVNWLNPEQTQQARGLVIKSLSISQLASVAALQTPDYATQLIQRYLLAGKPVWVLQTELPEQTKGLKYSLRQELQTLQTRVERYGLVFLTPETWSLVGAARVRKAKNEAVTFITEKQLQELLLQKDFQLPAGSRLTPLARDFAMAHHLTI